MIVQLFVFYKKKYSLFILYLINFFRYVIILNEWIPFPVDGCYQKLMPKSVPLLTQKNSEVKKIYRVN